MSELIEYILSLVKPCRVPISSHQLCNTYSFCVVCPEHNKVIIRECGVYKRIEGTNVLLDKNAYVIGYRFQGRVKLEQNEQVRFICQRYRLCFRQSQCKKKHIPLSCTEPLYS